MMTADNPDAVTSVWHIPFLTKRLEDSSLLVANHELFTDSGDAIVANYGYITSERNEKSNTGHHGGFQAERYGGTGILSHGGGVRCGSIGAWQVKGMGRNLLAGADVPEVDSNGCMHLSEALREAIWGELCHRALPFGGARIGAVIATGQSQDYGKGVMVRTGLAVRQSVTRPGNFLRSIYFRPGAEMKRIAAPSDAARVRAAINALPYVLAAPRQCSAADWSALPAVSRLNLGLHEMMARFGRQTAAAQARRIMHGAITASNVALDGRWLDYGTVSALPGRRNVKHMQPFWADGLHYQRIAVDLCFYIGKYFLSPEGKSLPQPTSLMTAFASSHREWARWYFNLLTGLPPISLARVRNEPAASRLADQVIALAARESTKTWADYPCANNASGADLLGSVLLELAAHTGNEARDAALASLIPAVGVRGELVRAYAELLERVAMEGRRDGIGDIGWQRLCIVNAAKAAHTPKSFLRCELLRQTDALDAECKHVDEYRTEAQALFDRLGDQASVAYQEASDWTSRLWKDGTLSIDYDARIDRIRVRDGSGDDMLDVASVASSDTVPRALRQMRDHWGGSMWNAMKQAR